MSTTPRRRRTIAPGIRREGNQLIAEARIGNWRDGSQGRLRQAFPLGTAIEKMQAWQYHAKSDLLLEAPVMPTAGSLAADIPVYLATVPAGSYKRDSVGILAHWIASPLGSLPRSLVTRVDVIAQIAKWQESGAAIGTCNRRLSRLRKLYHTLDGVTVPNPTDKIKFHREPEREPRDMSIRIVNLILDSLPDQGRAPRGEKRPAVSETKIRLRVMAWTGIPPATLRRVQPRDLDLDGARIHLTPRRKGAGAAGAWVQLLPPAVDALRDFAAAGLFGRSWSQSSMRKTWHVGIARARQAAARLTEKGDPSWARELAQLPPRSKPYDLRHSFASEIYRLTGDIRAVSELLQHADLETTKRYTKGAVSARVTAAIQTAAASYAAALAIPTPPAAPPRRGSLRLVRAAAQSSSSSSS